MRRRKNNRLTPPNCDRRGAVIVETAFAIPIILLLTIATLDLCGGIYLKKKSEIAAYEGARTATVPGSSDEAIRASVARYLDSRRIVYGSLTDVVTISSAEINDDNEDIAEHLESVTVSVALDLRNNGRLPITFPSRFVLGQQVVTEVTMLRGKVSP